MAFWRSLIVAALAAFAAAQSLEEEAAAAAREVENEMAVGSKDVSFSVKPDDSATEKVVSEAVEAASKQHMPNVHDLLKDTVSTAAPKTTQLNAKTQAAPKTAEPALAAAAKALFSVKVEPAKVEPAKVEPAKAKPAKVEPAKVEPAKAKPVKVEPAKAVPVKAAPAKAAPATAALAKPAPAKAVPAKAAPAKAAPAKAAPAKAAPAKAAPLVAEKATEAAAPATKMEEDSVDDDDDVPRFVGKEAETADWGEEYEGHMTPSERDSFYAKFNARAAAKGSKHFRMQVPEPEDPLAVHSGAGRMAALFAPFFMLLPL